MERRMITIYIPAWGFNCSELPLPSFFLVVFFFLVCSCLSHVLLAVSFILSLPLLALLLQKLWWCKWIFFRHASMLCGFFRLSLCILLKWMKKSSSGTPLNGVGILFPLTYQPIVSKTSFLERPKPHFSINLRHSAIISLHGRGEQLVNPTFVFLPLSFPSHV